LVIAFIARRVDMMHATPPEFDPYLRALGTQHTRCREYMDAYLIALF